jgi:hypothetical protein
VPTSSVSLLLTSSSKANRVVSVRHARADGGSTRWVHLEGRPALSQRTATRTLVQAQLIDTSHIRPIQKIATIHASSGLIRGIPIKRVLGRRSAEFATQAHELHIHHGRRLKFRSVK